MNQEQTITESGTFDFDKQTITKLVIDANDVIVKNLNMRNLTEKCLVIKGDGVTLEKCFFVENEPSNILIQVKGSHCKILNCLFEHMNEKGCIISIQVKKNKPSYCLIKDCNFRDMKECKGEVIRIGDTKSSLFDSKSIIVNNVFSNCDRELQLISNQSCSNVISFNKVFDCNSCIFLRRGRRCRVSYNYINGNIRNGCGGIVVSGKEHVINNNTIEGVGNMDNPLRTAIVVMCGEKNPKLSGYEQVKLLQIRNNDILGCEVAFSLGVSIDKKGEVLPERISIESNRIVKCNMMINHNEKCWGTNNSYCDMNDVLDKDVKLVIPKYEEETEDVEELYHILYKDDRVVESSDNECVDIPIPREDTEQKEEFSDLLEALDDLLLENKLNDDCVRCNDLTKTLERNKETYKVKINSLETELEFYKDFYKRIKKKLNL